MGSQSGRLKVTIGDQAGVIELYEKDCPNTIKALLPELPASCANLVHARFSGEECSFPIRRPAAPVERENQLYDCQPGDVGYFVESAAICFYYGRLRVISPGNVFGRIVENMPGLYRMFKLAWWLPDIPVTISAEG
jgi:hypothetical protein